MKDQRLQIKDIIDHIDDATMGKLDIPEFQRGFVWKPDKAKMFVDSLWRDYPVGTILVWESKYNSPRISLGGDHNKLWIVDGQQRITTLSLLFGRKPYWWNDASEWNKKYQEYDILVDISKPVDSLEFGLPNPVRKQAPEWISVRKILSSTDDDISNLAEELEKKINQKLSVLFTKMQSIKKISEYPLYEVIIDHELEDVAEIFTRLNMAGVKVLESDVIIALIAAKQEGWVRNEFNEYLKSLKDEGFELEPAILIRTLAIIGKGMGRLKNIPNGFWDKDSVDFKAGWEKTKKSITFIVKKLREYGVLSSDILPSHNTLIPLFVLHSKYGASFNFKKAFYWFILATRDGRYSGSSTAILDQDSKIINDNLDFNDVINALLEELRISKDFTDNDFLNDYRDRFTRLMLYLIVFNHKAKDWLFQDIRIGYDRSDNVLNEGYKPEWHHFFPKKILKNKNINDNVINCAANIVVLNEKSNKAFSSKTPYQYLEQFNVDTQRLTEQMIPTNREIWEIDNYNKFLSKRASLLTNAANTFLEMLRKG